MGNLNRFYKWNDQIISINGTPLGFYKEVPPTDYTALYTFEASNLTDSVGGLGTLSKGANTLNFFDASYKKIGNIGLYTRPANYAKDSAVYCAAPTDARKTYTVVGWSKVISFTTGAGNTATHAIIFCTTGAENYETGDYIAIRASDGKIVISRHGDFSMGTQAESSSAYTANAWNLYALQYDGDNLNGFINGVKVCTQATTTSATQGRLNFGAVGNAQNYSQSQYNFDQCRFYTYALSDAQIKAIYDAEV